LKLTLIGNLVVSQPLLDGVEQLVADDPQFRRIDDDMVVLRDNLVFDAPCAAVPLGLGPTPDSLSLIQGISKNSGSFALVAVQRSDAPWPTAWARDPVGGQFMANLDD